MILLLTQTQDALPIWYCSDTGLGMGCLSGSSSETELWRPEAVFWALSCSWLLLPLWSVNLPVARSSSRPVWGGAPFQEVTRRETECHPTIFNHFLLRIRNRRYTSQTRGKNLTGPGPSISPRPHTYRKLIQGKETRIRELRGRQEEIFYLL